MSIPGPGVPISINTIVGEFGGTAPHSLSEYYRGGGLVPNAPANAAIPSSGTIPMGSFYGATNRIAVPITIGASTYNYDVYANRGPAYVAGISDVVVTVNPGVYVGSTSTGAYAMYIPSAFNPADTVTIFNNGAIQGMGGGGGTGAPPGNRSGSPGAMGGYGLYVNRPTTIQNNGVIAGGGGGGGGGAGYTLYKNYSTGGGGGGGAGYNVGAGGSGGGYSPNTSYVGSPGSPGSLTSGGGGGRAPAGPLSGSQGGSGGSRGASGGSGASSPFGSGGGGGGAGYYIVGGGYVTWSATGTRLGNAA